MIVSPPAVEIGAMRQAIPGLASVILVAALWAVTAAPALAANCQNISRMNDSVFTDARLSVRESRLAIKSLNSAMILATAALEDENGGLRKLTGELKAAGGDLFYPPVDGTAHLLVQFRPLTLKVTVHHYKQLEIYDQQMTHYRLIKDYIRHYMERMEDWKESCPGMSVGNAWEWSGKQGNSASRAIKRTHRLIDLVEKRLDWLQRLSAWAQRTIPKAR